VRTCIIKNNVSNPVSLVIRHPDYEIIHCHFGHISNEAMRHVLDNVEGAEKICFPNKKYICCGCALESCTSAVSLRTLSILVRLLD